MPGDIDTPVTYSDWEPDENRPAPDREAIANAAYQRARLAEERLGQHLDGTYKPTGERRGRMRRAIR